MFKKSFTLVGYLILVAMLAFMSILPVAAMADGGDPPPKISPSGETYYAVPFSSVQPIKKSDISGPAGTTGCDSRTDGIDVYNALGAKVATYSQNIFWCYNGSTITSKTRTQTGTVYGPLYQFNGHIGNVESGGVGQGSYSAWTQGSFCEIAPGFGCVWNFYPWVNQTVYGTGASWGNARW